MFHFAASSPITRDGKFLVQVGDAKKIISDQYPFTQLKDKVKEAFNLQGSFRLQVYDDDFEEWADVTDIETLPSKCKLKVKRGKKRFRAKMVKDRLSHNYSVELTDHL